MKIDFDRAWLYQCMDVACYYVDWLTFGSYRLNGNARDAINPAKNKLPSKYFEVFENTPDFLPQKGDIMVYSKGSFDNEFGHINIVYGNVSLTSCLVIEQNWDGKARTGVKKRLEQGYVGVSHIIRPKLRK